jgi:hypothetical protein
MTLLATTQAANTPLIWIRNKGKSGDTGGRTTSMFANGTLFEFAHDSALQP